jgi:hypothetical protein
MSVRLSAGNDSASSGRIIMKFLFEYFSKICREKIQISLKSEKNGTLHEAQYTILIISGSVLLRMKIFSEKRCRENQNTHFKFNNSFRKSCRSWNMWNKFCKAGQATDDMAHAHFTLGTWGYKHTLSEYVILIASLLQQWFHERAPMLRYTYTVCLVKVFPAV